MSKNVGFGYKVQAHHLNFMLEQLLSSNIESSNEQRQAFVQEIQSFLARDVQGKRSMQKAVTALMKIWVNLSPEAVPLRDKALILAPALNTQEKVVLHWGMTLLAYPFFRDVTAEMGKLFYLHQEITSGQLARRIKEAYGDRRYVEVSTAEVLFSCNSWGVVKRIKPGLYTLPEPMPISSLALKAWLVEVILHTAEEDSLALDLIPNRPELFPFKLALNPAELEQQNLVFHRQGLDMIMVTLA